MGTCKVCFEPTHEFNICTSPVSGYRCDTLSESLSQPWFPLLLEFCNNCQMVFYRYIEEASSYLARLYIEHLSTYHLAPTLDTYLINFTENIISQFNIRKGSNVLEIGCNDGRLLDAIRKKSGCNVYGIEPSGQFHRQWEQLQIKVLNDYFCEKIIHRLKDVEYDLVYFRHVLEHVPDPVSFIENLSEIASGNTIIVIEVPYFKTVLDKKRIDNTGYSHLNYFTLTSINNIIRNSGFGIFDFTLADTDGGSVVVYIRKNHETPAHFPDSISLTGIKNFIAHIDEVRMNASMVLSPCLKNEVIGYGAGAKGQHLIHLLNLDKFISVVADDTPYLNDKYIPGNGLKILNPANIDWGKIKCVVNLVPTYPDVIKSKLPPGIKFIDFIN
ncbi:MAG: class I SAM-dependent methyltransferase [Bacteroidota bacterium]